MRSLKVESPAPRGDEDAGLEKNLSFGAGSPEDTSDRFYGPAWPFRLAPAWNDDGHLSGWITSSTTGALTEDPLPPDYWHTAASFDADNTDCHFGEGSA
jgi:hypothetical protein